MAGSSLLALIDDIASVLDDVSAMTKVAAKKTSGVLGGDLALNAQQLVGSGILAHGLPVTEGLVHMVSHSDASAPMVGDLLKSATSPLINIVTGIFTGAVVLSF